MTLSLLVLRDTASDVLSNPRLGKGSWRSLWR
jgi:hypothetical protein